MKTKYLKILSASVIAIILVVTSCIKDLDTVPIDSKVSTSASVYKDATAYKQVLAKCYSGLALTGQEGPSGKPDITGIDEGFGQYLRGYWYAQELTTDEAVMAWNDQTIKDFHFQKWTAADVFLYALYSRIFYQVSVCNEFIRESTDEKLDSRGITGADKANVQLYREEARFLRALSYYHALDLFGNVPFVDETNQVGKFLPVQKTRSELFTYIESELLDIEGKLKDAKTNEYGRADKAAAWMLLSKLYLNAKVYINTDKNTECLTWVKKVIASPYTLATNYAGMFLADNHTSNEVIFPIIFDGINIRTYGGTTFIIHAAVGGSMAPGDYGINGGWGGIRTTSKLADKFTDPSGATDKRAMFHTAGQSKVVNDVGVFTDGYGIKKFKNLTSAGVTGSDQTFTDTDFPLFRLADAYLMYAEAVKRGGSGGDAAAALDYVNALLTRAYGNVSGNITAVQLTLDYILDERARELYWECHRRTDLIRFGKFSSSTYLWDWKGGVKAGITTDDHLNIFPIPSADRGANPNLQQNRGY
jgi:hypothetical protein